MIDKSKSSEKRTKTKKVSEWAMAAQDARRQIEEAKVRIVSLQKSIEICEKKEAAGEPWPGDKSAATQPALQDGRGV